MQKMNKLDWSEYIAFLRRDIEKEGQKKDSSSRDNCIKAYNMNTYYNDLNDSKRQLLLS